MPSFSHTVPEDFLKAERLMMEMKLVFLSLVLGLQIIITLIMTGRFSKLNPVIIMLLAIIFKEVCTNEEAHY